MVMNHLTSASYWIRAAASAQVDLDQVASQNYDLPVDIHREVRLEQVEFLRQILVRRAAPARVLDLGCGPGTWALELAPLVDFWLGIDVAPAFVTHAQNEARARGLHHLQFRAGDFLESWDERSFDLIVLGGTLGYLSHEQMVSLLERVREQLAPGGIVYVRVSTIPGIYPRLQLKGRYPICYRKETEYLSVFRQLGFRVEVSRDYAFTRGLLATAYTFLARRLGRTGMTAYRWAGLCAPLSFGLARLLLDLTPLPQSSLFILR